MQLVAVARGFKSGMYGTWFIHQEMCNLCDVGRHEAETLPEELQGNAWVREQQYDGCGDDEDWHPVQHHGQEVQTQRKS